MDFMEKNEDKEPDSTHCIPEIQAATGQADKKVEKDTNKGDSSAEIDKNEGDTTCEDILELLLNTDETSDGVSEMNLELEKMLDLKNTLSTPPPVTVIDPLECRLMQQEEIESLKAIFDRDITPLNDDSTCFSVDVKYLSDQIKDEDAIKLWFSLPPNYPSVPPVFEIESSESGSFSYDNADQLYDTLMKETINRVGGMMLYDVITIAQEHLTRALDGHKERMEKRVKEDEERRKQIELEDALKSKKGFIPSSLWNDITTGFDETKGAESMDEEAESLNDEDSALWEGPHNRLELINRRVNYHPRQFIGPISNLIKVLPPTLEITRIENIVRQDLAERFTMCEKEMVRTLWQKERKFPMLYSIKPQIAFHGTLRKSLPSIVQHGLVIPGQDNPVSVRCGSSLGKGIYLSPDANFSLWYTDSQRLIVCAVLQGFKCNYNRPVKHHLGKFFTVISDSELEWVFFNAYQILPCYVIQVRVKASNVKNPAPPPLVSAVNPVNEDDNNQKVKAKLQARARKFLPFGFGPGAKTEILEAGEIDDDEEDYGDYQLLRHTEEEDNKYNVGIIEETHLQEYRTGDNDMF